MSIPVPFPWAGLLPGARRPGVLAALMPGGAGGGGAGEWPHRTVMADEVTRLLAPAPGRSYFDLTLGYGGHSERLLEAGGSVAGFDRDPLAREAAAARLARFGDRFRLVAANFARFGEAAREAGLGPVDGIVMDLGVSSPQLDDAGRGFSFMRDGPLDMRMGTDAPRTAEDWVNEASETELERIFREFGEEPQARKAARAVVARRAAGRLRTTGELAACLEDALGRHGGHHPATRVFQALRIAVNGELEALESALAQMPDWLKPGSRLVILTFQSLDDRRVKQFFRSHSQPTIDRPEWPAPRPNPDWHFTDLTRHPLTPGPDEVAANPRARSAKLRSVERRQP